MAIHRVHSHLASTRGRWLGDWTHAEEGVRMLFHGPNVREAGAVISMLNMGKVCGRLSIEPQAVRQSVLATSRPAIQASFKCISQQVPRAGTGHHFIPWHRTNFHQSSQS